MVAALHYEIYNQARKEGKDFDTLLAQSHLGEPIGVARLIAFLASDDASYVTGQVLSVSGGLTMAG